MTAAVSEPLAPATNVAVTTRPVWLWPVLVAALIRIPIAFFADDQWGDAPIRLSDLQQWVQHPGLWWDFNHIHQYGPLPTNLLGLLALAVGPIAASRFAVVSTGAIACGVLAVLADRFGGRRAGLAAGLALALSPVHIQVSTTYASEAIYMVFALATIWAAWTESIGWCALFTFAASTTRYDAWIWIPFIALWWLSRTSLPLQRRLVAIVLLGIGPLSILVANQLLVGDAFTPMKYIQGDHRMLVDRSQAAYGVLPWRLAMIPYWPAAIVGVLTPAFGLAIAWGAFKALRRPTGGILLPLAMGLTPAILYTFNTVVLGTYWPMARFALAPTAMLAIAIPALRSRTLIASVVTAVAFNIALVIVGDGEPGIGMRVAAVSPFSQLPPEVKAGGKALRSVQGPVALGEVPTYEDVLIAYDARMDRYKLLHPQEGTTPRRIVTVDGGKWDKELKTSSQAFGHPYRLAGEVGRVRWWDVVDS
jgi:hypothetical protein